jgi:hypothetical protein
MPKKTGEKQTIMSAFPRFETSFIGLTLKKGHVMII